MASWKAGIQLNKSEKNTSMLLYRLYRTVTSNLMHMQSLSIPRQTDSLQGSVAHVVEHKEQNHSYTFWHAKPHTHTHANRILTSLRLRTHSLKTIIGFRACSVHLPAWGHPSLQPVWATLWWRSTNLIAALIHGIMRLLAGFNPVM